MENYSFLLLISIKFSYMHCPYLVKGANSMFYHRNNYLKTEKPQFEFNGIDEFLYVNQMKNKKARN